MAGKQLPIFRMFIGFTFGITMAYGVEYVGALRLGEILAIPYLLMSLPRFFSYFKSDKLLQYSLITVTCWIVFQLASDWHNRTPSIEILKGIANLGVAASSFMFLVVIVRKNVSVLLAILIGRAIGNFYLRDFLQTSEEILSNEYWDLRIGIWAGPIVLFFGILLVTRMRLLVVFGYLAYGAAAISLGGRSHGMAYSLTAVSVLLLPNVRRRISMVSRKTLVRGIISGATAILLVYPAFVYVGLQGLITDKTEQQLLDTENPYNPIELLLTARGGLQFGLNAIKRRPIAGYGSRAYSGDYLPGGLRRDSNYIHSMVMESWAFGGIGSGLCCLFLLFLIHKQCLKLVSFSNSRCNLIASFCAISQTWSFFFSPLAALRLAWPMAMIMIWCVDQDNKTSSQRIVQVAPNRFLFDERRAPAIKHD